MLQISFLERWIKIWAHLLIKGKTSHWRVSKKGVIHPKGSKGSLEDLSMRNNSLIKGRVRARVSPGKFLGQRPDPRQRPRLQNHCSKENQLKLVLQPVCLPGPPPGAIYPLAIPPVSRNGPGSGHSVQHCLGYPQHSCFSPQVIHSQVMGSTRFTSGGFRLLGRRLVRVRFVAGLSDPSQPLFLSTQLPKQPHEWLYCITFLFKSSCAKADPESFAEYVLWPSESFL